MDFKEIQEGYLIEMPKGGISDIRYLILDILIPDSEQSLLHQKPGIRNKKLQIGGEFYGAAN